MQTDNCGMYNRPMAQPGLYILHPHLFADHDTVVLIIEFHDRRVYGVFVDVLLESGALVKNVFLYDSEIKKVDV